MIDRQAALAPSHWLARIAAQPLVVLLAALSSGIILDRYSGPPLSLWFGGGLTALLTWSALWRLRRHGLAAPLLLVCAAATGGAWHHVYWRCFAADELGRSADAGARPVHLEATALRAPRLIPPPPDDPFRIFPVQERTQLTLRVNRVRDGRRWRSASGRTTLFVDGPLSDIGAGDRVQVFAMLRRPAAPRNPGEFDARSHRRGRRELFELRARVPEGIVLAQPAPPWCVRRALAQIRMACRSRLEAHLQDRQAELAAAVLLGARDELPIDRVEDFFLTGTIHLLAISGLHIGILAGGLWWLLRLVAVPRRGAVIAAAVFVIAYAVLVEARPPVVRAAILIVAVCAARLSGRRILRYNTLAAAALLLLAVNPAQLFEVGPQLSFLAVGTMAAVGGPWSRRDDPLDRLIDHSRPWPWRFGRHVMGSFGSLVMVTTLIWLVALPLVMYRFQLVSPIAVVLNPLIWIPMSVALFSGFGVLLFGWLLPPVSAVLGWLCNVSLALLEYGVSWAVAVEGGYSRVPPPALWWVLGFYLVLATSVAARRHLPARWRLALLTAWLAAGCWLSYPRPGPSDSLSCTFVSVGHGACTIIQLPDGRTLLCDAGSMGIPASAVRAISGSLWSSGIRHLDAVVLSHAHADHYNALPGLLQQFSVGVVYVPPMMFEQTSEPLEALREAIQLAGVEIRHLYAGHRLAVGPETCIEVWHPPRRGIVGGPNANSLVLGIEYQGLRILLPADLEPPGLEDVLAEEPRRWTLVTAPHHGSDVEQQERFAAWSQPSWAVISGPSARRTAAAEAAYRERGARALHTARDGAIRATIHRGQLTVSRWQGRWQPLWPPVPAHVHRIRRSGSRPSATGPSAARRSCSPCRSARGSYRTTAPTRPA